MRKYRNPLAFVEQAPRQTRHSDCHGLAAQFNDRLAAPTIHALLAVSLVRQKAARRLRHSPDHHSSPRHHGADCRAERIRARGRDDTIAAAPNDWLPAYLIATAHLWNDDLEGAEEVLTSRSLTANTVPAVQMLRWEIFEQLGRTYYGQLLGHYPYSFRAHVVRARILDAQDKPEALDEYKAAIAANPTQAGARLDLAYYYLANANIPQALSECQQVLGLNPYSGDAKACVGRIYVEMRQPDQAELKNESDKAIAEYKKALELDPSQNKLHYLLAGLYRRLGRDALADREDELFQRAGMAQREEHVNFVQRYYKGGGQPRAAGR